MKGEASSYRSCPSFAVGGVQPDAICIVCGAELNRHHFLEVRGFYETHCPDHDFEHDPYRKGHFCVHCDSEREYEPMDGDISIFGGSYRSGDPIGTPASAMNGNAAARHENPAAWANWVSFCERNGHQ